MEHIESRNNRDGFIDDSAMEAGGYARLKAHYAEIANAVDADYTRGLLAGIYGLFQDYSISEEQEAELYGIVDPGELYNSPAEYWRDGMYDTAVESAARYVAEGCPGPRTVKLHARVTREIEVTQEQAEALAEYLRTGERSDAAAEAVAKFTEGISAGSYDDVGYIPGEWLMQDLLAGLDGRALEDFRSAYEKGRSFEAGDGGMAVTDDIDLGTEYGPEIEGHEV